MFYSYVTRLFSIISFFIIIPVMARAQEAESRCKQVAELAGAEMRAQQRKAMEGYYRKTASEMIDVIYHRCEWNLDPNFSAISGTITTHFLPKVLTSRVTFDLFSGMIVDKVTRNNVDIPFTRDGNTVVIEVGVMLNPGRMDSVSVRYHGNPAASGFGSFTKSNHSGIPVVWTLSEPYGASDWWPCKNTLDDKIDSIDVLLTCPVAYKGISNGLRQSAVLSGDGSLLTTHWKHRYPIVSYLICLAVTNYEEFNNTVQLGSVTLPMQTFCYPESVDMFKKGTQATLDAMQMFHYLFGDYPFIREKYGHTQFGWGGGEEHQTNSFMTNAGEELCAHELAHQWFGNKITCGSWQDIWLNEGFASYLADLYMEGKYPENILARRRADILSITSETGGSVKVDDTLSVNRIFNGRLTYTKGAHLLYMLQFKLGTYTFLKAIRAYQKDSSLVYGFAKTANLQYHLEKESGMKLDSFFRQWYEGQGYPSYGVQWQQIGNGTVKIRMNQVTSHASVSFFQLPVPLKFKNAQRDTTVIVDNTYNGQSFIRDIGFVADSMFIDPEYWLISKNNTVTRIDDEDMHTRTLFAYPNPFRSDLNVLLDGFPGNKAELALYTLLGQRIWTGSYSLYKGKEYFTITPPAVASGQYILCVTDETGARKSISLLKY